MAKYRGMTKEEKKAYHKAYYEAHKEKVKADSLKSYYANHEKNKEKRRQYHQDHREEMIAKVKIYYHAHKDEKREQRREYAKAHRDKSRSYKLTRNYGISLEDYNQMCKSQDGKCAICGNEPDKNGLVVDHNHETKKVRKLLCKWCNLALGYSRESTKTLNAMIDYIKEFS